MTAVPIHILGNVDLDLSLGPLKGLPNWGTEVVALGPSTYRPGGAAGNTALALAGLMRRNRGLTLADLEGAGADPQAVPRSEAASGINAYVYCALGDDEQGRRLQAQFQVAGLGGRLEGLAGEATSLGLALVREDGERAFVTDLGALRRMDLDWAAAALGNVRGPGYFLLNGVSLLPALPPEQAALLLRSMRERGLQTCLDTGWDVDNWPSSVVQGWRLALASVDFFFPNDLEAGALTGETDPVRAARILQDISGGTVVVKLGAEGAVLADVHGIRTVPTEPLPVADTTGAGDVFNAGFLYGLSLGWTPDEAVRLGHRVAAQVLANRRTYFPSLDELDLALAGPGPAAL
ncbi:MAG: carbohydrate kinase family protein [Bacillota bacterium]